MTSEEREAATKTSLALVSVGGAEFGEWGVVVFEGKEEELGSVVVAAD